MAIYLDDRDRVRFLDTLARAVTRYRVACHAYCLMPNHYHLLLTPRDITLSLAVRYLNGVYGQWWNRRHQRVGHVFQGRFKAQVVEGTAAFLRVYRYVARNPVRGGLTSAPVDWNWSSHRATLGLTVVPSWLTVATLHELMAPVALDAYVRHVSPEDGIAAAVRGDHRVIGDAAGAPRWAARRSREVPLVERTLGRPSLADVFADATSKRCRNEAMETAHFEYGYTQAQVAAFLGLHYSTVSRLLKGRPAGAPAPPGTQE